jgi:threonine/homoserine efflux transporter RhtA
MLTLTYLNPLLAIVIGVLILVVPRLLNYLIAIYLIVTGVMGLAAHR